MEDVVQENINWDVRMLAINLTNKQTNDCKRSCLRKQTNKQTMLNIVKTAPHVLLQNIPPKTAPVVHEK
jgi:hypothetical protein